MEPSGLCTRVSGSRYSFAVPQSMSLILPVWWRSNRKLAGLMSQWTRWCEWTCSRASIYAAQQLAREDKAEASHPTI